ncbi:Uma2 family endonuclease [Candidatus Synechococcus calcipolaris G9]|uniref:Uma2 family endonuclease n=1 Tax=Candidatus Synechococcus calcipolaris G9 TaxID=1497997 RepID=A0ABT6F242_9SYNE|nr:Uma2 family endonuclease [Candidatus Synechococcus calcipolaris]MDG2991929.1 Uma2 family endonuclease [Candidatus Synechococcus calcipolaris G9]
MTGVIKPAILTLEAFLKQPETTPASEFIDGRVEQKPMPQGKHSRLQLRFCDQVNESAESAQIAMAFPELRCTFAGRSIVPDAAVFCWERIPFDADGEVANAFETHPDWTVEILSPDQTTTKVIRNILHCMKHGSLLGWLIDPEERVILVFHPEQAPTELVGDEVLPVLPGLALVLTVNDVFAWLKGRPRSW